MLTYADECKEENRAMGAFLGHWNLACEDMRLACLRKARCLAWATWFYFAALVLIGLPLVVSAIKLLQHPAH
jgi:hypothetical protein